ncbi:ATP-binding cassette domain-containing protein [Vibrio metschnikovii]
MIDAPQQTYGEDTRPLASGAICLNNLSFSYDGTQTVLKQINLTIPHQHFVALVGHTGSGKSTIASLLMGFYPVEQEALLIDGRAIHDL